MHQVVVHGREFTVLRFRACTSTSAPRSHVNANIRSLESRMNGYVSARVSLVLLVTVRGWSYGTRLPVILNLRVVSASLRLCV